MKTSLKPHGRSASPFGGAAFLKELAGGKSHLAAAAAAAAPIDESVAPSVKAGGFLGELSSKLKSQGANTDAKAKRASAIAGMANNSKDVNSFASPFAAELAKRLAKRTEDEVERKEREAKYAVFYFTSVKFQDWATSMATGYQLMSSYPEKKAVHLASKKSGQAVMWVVRARARAHELSLLFFPM